MKVNGGDLLTETSNPEPDRSIRVDLSDPNRRLRPTPWGAVLKEAFVSATAQPMTTALIIIMVAGMCAAVLLTSGRTVGAEQKVIGSIDSAGTRAIVVRSDPTSGLDTTVLDRLSHLEGVEWAAAFSLAQDTVNSAIDGGTPVPLRLAWADNWTQLGLPVDLPGTGGVAYASELALAELGLDDPVGSIHPRDGNGGFTVGGRVSVPSHLDFMEPFLIAPQPPTADAAPVGALVVIADRPDLVAPIADTIGSLLAVDDPTKVSVSTSESLATLRALVEGQLGAFGRNLTLGILAVSAFLVAALQYGTVMLRRKDYGRRRALGASQRLIITLITFQTGIVATAGAALGSAAALLILSITQDPLPGWTYVAGVGVLAVVTATLSAILPGIFAARREPIKELRVP